MCQVLQHRNKYISIPSAFWKFFATAAKFHQQNMVMASKQLTGPLAGGAARCLGEPSCLPAQSQGAALHGHRVGHLLSTCHSQTSLLANGNFPCQQKGRLLPGGVAAWLASAGALPSLPSPLTRLAGSGRCPQTRHGSPSLFPSLCKAQTAPQYSLLLPQKACSTEIPLARATQQFLSSRRSPKQCRGRFSPSQSFCSTAQCLACFCQSFQSPAAQTPVGKFAHFSATWSICSSLEASECTLTIFTVYSIHFISYVWAEFCRALHYTNIRKHGFTKRTRILRYARHSAFIFLSKPTENQYIPTLKTITALKRSHFSFCCCPMGFGISHIHCNA